MGSTNDQDKKKKRKKTPNEEEKGEVRNQCTPCLFFLPRAIWANGCRSEADFYHKSYLGEVLFAKDLEIFQKWRSIFEAVTRYANFFAL